MGESLEKKEGPSNIIKLPNREGGYEEITDNLIKELNVVIENDLSLHVSDEDIEKRKALFLKSPNRGEMLRQTIESSERESEESLHHDRAKVVLYLAAALAYKEIPEEEEEE